MIELDSDKWLLVKIACEKMAGTTTDRPMQESYEWLIDVSAHNAKEAQTADDYGISAQELVDREPSPIGMGHV